VKREGAHLAALLKVEEEFTTVDVIEDEIELIFCLKSVMEIDNERVFNLLKDLKGESKHFAQAQEGSCPMEKSPYLLPRTLLHINMSYLTLGFKEVCGGRKRERERVVSVRDGRAQISRPWCERFGSWQ